MKKVLFTLFVLFSLCGIENVSAADAPWKKHIFSWIGTIGTVPGLEAKQLSFKDGDFANLPTFKKALLLRAKQANIDFNPERIVAWTQDDGKTWNLINNTVDFDGFVKAVRAGSRNIGIGYARPGTLPTKLQ